MLQESLKQQHDQIVNDINRKAEEQRRLQEARVSELESRLEWQERETKVAQAAQEDLTGKFNSLLETMWQERETKAAQEAAQEDLKGKFNSLQETMWQRGMDSTNKESEMAELKERLRKEKEKARKKEKDIKRLRAAREDLRDDLQEIKEDHPGYNGMVGFYCSRSRHGGCGAHFWAKPSKTLKCPSCGVKQGG